MCKNIGLTLIKIEGNYAYIRWYNEPIEAYPIKNNVINVYGIEFKIENLRREIDDSKREVSSK